MGRFLAAIVFLGLFHGCIRPWVGRPVAQLEKEMGRPRRIRTEGTNRVYIYPDTLAGRGVMTFTVDPGGIIRSWYATPDVPGALGDMIAIDDAGNPVFDDPNSGGLERNR
jgi:hypothetical protein